MAVLAGLAGRGPVTVIAVPALPGETARLARHTVVLEGLDMDTGLGGAAAAPTTGLAVAGAVIALVGAGAVARVRSRR